MTLTVTENLLNFGQRSILKNSKLICSLKMGLICVKRFLSLIIWEFELGKIFYPPNNLCPTFVPKKV